ncbi:YicC family protein [Candidatus Dependentiae bacterium]|nr:YicC family protein [Candidatus Dependentiae bacterium]
MLLSMTGFSTVTTMIDLKSAGRVSLAIEVKAVNSRFFESVCKLPSLLSALEVSINSILQRSLLRGRVYLTIRLGRENEAFESIALSERALQGYVAAAQAIKEKFGVQGELTLHDLMQLPNVFVAERSELSSEEETVVLDLIKQAAEKLNATRREEGNTLQQDIDMRLLLCSKKVEEIKAGFELLMVEQKKLIVQYLEPAQNGDEQAKANLESAYSVLNKIDINEEVTRFKSHLSSVQAFLNLQQTEKGKRLDFILQELMREVNTMMAKCSNYQISSAAVDIKVELEKIREQIQNIV